MLGEIESASNIIGLVLKNYHCKVLHPLKGQIGSVLSDSGEVVLNKGWWRESDFSKENKPEFNTYYELDDSEMSLLNGLVFDQILKGQDFLNSLQIECDINV
jgi:hypothetical protein